VVGPAAAASSNGTAAGLVATWFGEVVQPRGARGPFSYAALTVAENGGLYGEIGYWDVQLRKKRAFQVIIVGPSLLIAQLGCLWSCTATDSITNHRVCGMVWLRLTMACSPRVWIIYA